MSRKPTDWPATNRIYRGIALCLIVPKRLYCDLLWNEMVWITACRNFCAAGFHFQRCKICPLRGVLLRDNSLGSKSKRDAREVRTANQRKTEETCEEHKRSYIQGDDAWTNISGSNSSGDSMVNSYKFWQHYNFLGKYSLRYFAYRMGMVHLRIPRGIERESEAQARFDPGYPACSTWSM